MDNKRMDRRVKYTRALLKDALVELMEEMHISSISVKQLCERADVHRSTFYAHFADPADLLRQIEEEVFENVKAYLDVREFNDELPVTVQKLTGILEYAKQNAKLLTVLFSEHSEISFQYDVMKYLDIVSLAPDNGMDERTREYITLFGTSGCLSIVVKWLQDGTPEAPPQIAGLIQGLLFSGLRGEGERWGAAPDPAQGLRP